MAAGAQVLQFPTRQQPVEEDRPARSLSKLKKSFTNAVSAKWAESNEAAEAERYLHAVQWTTAQLKILNERGQPPVVFNRLKRKINTISGIIEKLRQDPKAYPRNPQRQADDGAEVATKVLNYALGWEWTSLSTQVARRSAVRGISGAELVVEDGDQGDPEISWDEVDARDYFYDESSVKPDFSDARFMGTTRWTDLDEAVDKWPDFEEELSEYVDNSATGDTDRGDERRTMNWVSKERKRVRIVDHWYMVGRQWHYAIYCGEVMLEWGQSPWRDEKGRSTSKFEMMSWDVDQDGDRYGAHRDLKGAQDEVNQRRSKALHQLSSRKVIADDGAVDDVEKARREYARADGWVVKNAGKEIITEDAAANAVVEGNLQMLAEAKAEIDTFGPNPGLVGTEIPAESGRAIQLLQAAGIAEMGPFMMTYKHWKLRVYRKTWCACQQVWTSQRWIRVTDDENLAQFIEINGWSQDEFGNVQVLNQLAALDVDIVIDEGPDSVTTMADTFDTLVALGKGGAQIPPEMFIELSPLPSSQKQRIMQQIAKAQEPKPMDQQAMMLQLGLLQAQIGELQSKAQLNAAKAQETLQPEPRNPQVDTPADLAKANLDVAKAREIDHKIAVGAHVPEQRQPPPEQPGLFDLNAAKARKEHTQADLAEQQAQLAWAKGTDEHDESLARQRLQGAQALKTYGEAQTIKEAPPGMLTKPPPARPASLASGRKPGKGT